MWYSSRSTDIVQGILYVMYMCACAWPNIAQVYSVPYYTSAARTCNRQFLLPYPFACTIAFHIRFVLHTGTPSLYIAMLCPLSSSVYTCYNAWYSASVIIIICHFECVFLCFFFG